ncbi:MAG: SDR family NAD(P)-dependent oxidoreductase [Spirochaetales bacterium]|nr:SDR family NAD(P)-dependent oxidoreductase [Spirochaetales bacterium]
MDYTTIAPIIRGVYFDGCKGPIVQYSKENVNNSVNIEIPKSADETNISEILKNAASDKIPASIHIKDIGTFLLGTRLDNVGKNLVKEEKALKVSGKIAVVTGGAQGFGEQLVRGLFKEGAIVAIVDMNFEGAKKLADTLNAEAKEERAFACAVNVSDEESVKKMIDEIVSTVGGIDIFVNNAGVLKAGSVKELSLKDFHFVTDVNYIGYFLCAKFASPVMALQNSASGGKYFTDIIQINSKSGLVGSNKNGAYAGGKFGGIGLTQSFALELVTDNIKVNSICPGNFFDGPLWSDPDRGLFVQYLNTGKVPGAKTVADVKKFYESKVPMGRGCEGGDVIKALFYLVEQKYETGQALPVTGGQVMLN